MKRAGSPNIPLERLRSMPEMPGVYLMKDAAGAVIYVGKAKDLRARVRSYFSGADERYSVQYLLEKVRSIDTIVTTDERQALVLESDLIRNYKPRYNIRLKDDRSYLSVRIDMDAEWPRLELFRGQPEENGRYIGPFPFSYELRTMLELIKRTVPLRTCSDHVLRSRVRPCIEYQIKRCSAPCCLPVDRGAYLGWVEQAARMLQGKNSDVKAELESEMARASEELRFEDAAAIRDRLEVLKTFQNDQTQVLFGTSSQDAFGIYREGARVEVAVLLVRKGRLLEARNFGFPEAPIPDEEVIGSLLSQYYSGAVEVPEEIILPFPLEDIGVREELLREKRGSRVDIVIPKIGAKARLLALALQNARENFTTRFAGTDFSDTIAKALQAELSLEELPRTIECVDVSHFQGGSTVASVVAFQDGKPDKSRYRHFILTQEGKPDDFASMREVVLRHLSRAAEENTLSDLMVIDGGPAQLSQALKIRKELGLQRPVMVGLAKKRTEKLAYRAHIGAIRKMRERKPERIYNEAGELPIILPPESETLHLLERIRNEAHRFAIRFHRSRRKRRTFQSQLENIQGVGPKRRKELLKVFGSLQAIAQAEPEAIAAAVPMPLALAERIVRILMERLKSSTEPAT